MADKRITQTLRGGLVMLEEIRKTGKDCILHDAQTPRPVTSEWFEHGYWRRKSEWTAVSGGRGAGGRVGANGQWFLRHYFRGGKAAILSQDRYFYTGAERVRSFAEFRMLARLKKAGLPVPAPLAARYRMSGLSYSADLITEWIADTQTLASVLRDSEDRVALMARVGATMARFHCAGVCHADLNAHNILIGANDAVWVIDFDRSRIRKPGRWYRGRLKRLRRSLGKLGLDYPGVFEALCTQHDRDYR